MQLSHSIGRLLEGSGIHRSIFSYASFLNMYRHPQAYSSSFTNEPEPSLTAARKVLKMKTRIQGSAADRGIPVSRPNCASAPLPVITSPTREAANPSCAIRPTNSSLAFVKPKPSVGIRLLTTVSGVTFVFSSGTNFPLAGASAAKRLNAIRASTKNSVSCSGTPTSMSNCASGPLPVSSSPSIEEANPSIAIRPTNSSLLLVKPNSISRPA
mmetsp:Transcript_33730/g.86201  ORF Transcript_33730/g.86201 Transcript_33730/m.86201 type:complete len:212 (+) Transcript_33730:109-744(+)